MARSTAVTVILSAWLDSFVDAVNTQLIRHETDRRIRNQDNPCKDCWNGNGDGDCILSDRLGKCTNKGEAFFCQNGNGESGVEFCEAGDKDRHPDNPANADAQARPAATPRPRAQQSAPSTPAPQAQVDKCESWCKRHTSPWEERCAWDTRACSACAQCTASSRPSSQPRPQASPQPRPRAQNAQPQRSQGNQDVANDEDADEIEQIEDANDTGAIGGVGPPGPLGEQGPAGPPGVLPKGKAEGSSTNLIYGSLAVQAFLFIGLCLYVRNQVAGVDDIKEYCDESTMAVQKQIRQMQDEGRYGNQGMSANAVVISPEANALWRIHKIPEREDTYTIESLLARGNYLNLQGDASADAPPAENEDASFDFVPPSDVAADAEAR